MTILTHYTLGTYKAQIRSSVETGFRQLYTASCTAGDKLAAEHVVRKYFGDQEALTVCEVKDAGEIRQMIGGFMDDPKRKQVFLVWRFGGGHKNAAHIITRS